MIFNANPLLRFDGYFIFSEFIEVPNLGTRSNQYTGYLFKRYVLDVKDAPSPVTAKGEAKWLFSYGLCSGVYRVFISLFIAFWVAGKLFIIGMLLAVWAIISQLIFPAFKWFSRLLPVARDAQRLTRLAIVCSAFLLLIASLFVPVGHGTYAEGMINLPEDALLRVGSDGIITEVMLADGVVAETGTKILKLENLELATQRDILQARLEETLARQKDSLLLDRTQSEVWKVKVSAIEAELNDVAEQLSSLEITNTVPGVVFLPFAGDLPGKFVNRGEVIGYVTDLRQVSARVLIPQSGIDAVMHETHMIMVRLRSRPDEILQATGKLPGRMLGSGAGGDVAVDIRDESGVQAISNIFEVEISLPMRDTGSYLGQRVYVRFIHQQEILGNQLLRWLNRLFLQVPFI